MAAKHPITASARPRVSGVSASPASTEAPPVPRKKAAIMARRPKRSASQPIGSEPRPYSTNIPVPSARIGPYSRPKASGAWATMPSTAVASTSRL